MAINNDRENNTFSENTCIDTHWADPAFWRLDLGNIYTIDAISLFTQLVSSLSFSLSLTLWVRTEFCVRPVSNPPPPFSQPKWL